MCAQNGTTAKPRNIVLRWEMWGIPIIFLAGALVHFLFEWSGDLAVVGVFAPVNESVWEHFKLAFWPTCIYAAIEYRALSRQVDNFLTAKAAALYIVPATVGIAFYAYTAIADKEILAADILSFLVAVVMAQFASYRILTAHALPRYAGFLSVSVSVLLAAVLAGFSFYPPQLPIFMDGRGFYGMPP